VFIQRLILVLAAVAAAAPLPAQTLVTHGDFQLPRVRANQLGAWQAAYGTPQIIADKGCYDAGYVAMSGDEPDQAIRQPVALMKGVRYEVSLCARFGKGIKSEVHVELHASTTPLDTRECPAETCEAISGAKKAIAAQWKKYQFQFTSSRDYAYLTVSASKADVDNVSVVVADRLPGEKAPLVNADTRSVIRDQYIVLYKPGTRPREANLLESNVKRLGGKILFQYRTVFFGFAARLEPDVLEVVRASPHVQWVEADQRMRSSSVEEPVTAGTGHDAALPTGLDRIGQRLLPLDGTFQVTETGQGVHVYLLDSGVREDHTEFGDRASVDLSVVSDSDEPGDCAGHGTHVAGTVGGKHYGVARKVRLHSVRVMDCNGEGPMSAVIRGVEWITQNRRSPAVAVMSISGETTLLALDAAVTTSIQSGVTYVVAAHNRARDACHYSPARIPEAITVGAANPLSDMRYVTSNHGPCLDLFAPGTAILSAGISCDSASARLSGTSMAAAHVAGVAALYLQLNQYATPDEVWYGIHSNNNVATTPGWPGILNPGRYSPNELLHCGVH
jgi:subtilisin family serine protease